MANRELDHAMLRRLEKRILVGLPTQEARYAMFKHYLPPVVCSQDSNGLELLADLQYNVLAEVSKLVIVISKFLLHHSKPKRRVPAYSRALNWLHCSN